METFFIYFIILFNVNWIFFNFISLIFYYIFLKGSKILKKRGENSKSSKLQNLLKIKAELQILFNIELIFKLVKLFFKTGAENITIFKSYLNLCQILHTKILRKFYILQFIQN